MRHRALCTRPDCPTDCIRNGKRVRTLFWRSSSSSQPRFFRISDDGNRRISSSVWRNGWSCARGLRSSFPAIDFRPECQEFASSFRSDESCSNCSPSRWKPEMFNLKKLDFNENWPNLAFCTALVINSFIWILDVVKVETIWKNISSNFKFF